MTAASDAGSASLPSAPPEHQGDARPGSPAPEAVWPRERVELIRRTICPKGIGDDEFNLFIAQCQRSGLDPLLKEAFCVGRNKKTSAKGQPDKWATVYEFQPSEAGMLARAERFPDFLGCQASAAYAEDDIVIDQGKGEVEHRFNPAKRKGALVGGWARIVRKGKLPVVVWLDFSGYVQQTPLWAKIPTTMIEKCARVAALRKAYPEAFGGLYIREELPAEEFTGEPSSATPRVPEPKQDEPATSGTQEAQEKPLEIQDEGKVHSTVVAFGPHKGKTAAELSDDELSGTIDMAHEKLMADPRAKWAKAMRSNLTMLEAEAELRCRVPVSPSESTDPSPA